MGIPGLNSWFKRNFREAYVRLDSINTDHLYVDMNGVLHIVLRKAKNRNQFFMLLYQKCDYILTACMPKKSVMFALDGPAPIAKLLTQRVRRKRIELSESDKKGKTVSPLALTPGTQFMQEVHEAIAYFICQRLMGSKWRHLRMELSGATVQGEGECKMLSRLQRPREWVKPSDSHAFIGNDSDLLMMTLMAEPEKIYVLGQILDSHTDLPASSGELSVFSLEKLKEPLLRQFRGIQQHKRATVLAIQRDLALACVLTRGNDYLPSVGGMSLTREVDYTPINKRENGLWDSYVKVLNEDKEFSNRSLVYRHHGTILLDLPFLYRVLDTAGIKSIDRKVNESQKGPDPELYLHGIRWLVDMYCNGICTDYRYVYDGMGPSSKELCDAILRQQRNDRDSSFGGQKALMHRLPLRPSECALALLPYQARQYVSKPIRHLMEPDSPIGDLYADCPDCTQFSVDQAELQRKLIPQLTLGLEIKEKLERMQHETPEFEKLWKELKENENQAEQIREKIRELSTTREAHMNETHPYRPFPIERIEAAVRKVPASYFDKDDHRVFTFGQEYVFKRSHVQVPKRSDSALFVPLRECLPAPPSDNFRKFKYPIPVVRTNSFENALDERRANDVLYETSPDMMTYSLWMLDSRFSLVIDNRATKRVLQIAISPSGNECACHIIVSDPRSLVRIFDDDRRHVSHRGQTENDESGWYSAPRELCVFLETPLVLHLDETTVRFPFSIEEARNLGRSMNGLLQTFKEKEKAAVPQRYDLMQYSYKASEQGTADISQFEILCNPNACSSAFDARLMVTLHSTNGIKVTGDAQLNQVKADLETYLSSHVK